jgi:hypothetical protein
MSDTPEPTIRDVIKLMNDQHERVLNRLTRIEGEVRDLRSEHSVTRDMVLKLPGAGIAAGARGRD